MIKIYEKMKSDLKIKYLLGCTQSKLNVLPLLAEFLLPSSHLQHLKGMGCLLKPDLAAGPPLYHVPLRVEKELCKYCDWRSNE